MIYLFGNCQMEFLGKALERLGLDCDHRPLATPLGPLVSGGNIPAELQAWNRRMDLTPYLHGRSFKNQFQALAQNDPAPSLFVVNLFHENEPLFAHETGWLFFVDPAAWNASPDFGAWMRGEFQQIKLPQNDYLNRWARFVAALRQSWPQVPILLASQLSHYPAFGPRPYSYLSCWEKVWERGGEFLRGLARELNCHLLDADRLFAGVWNAGADSRAGTQDMDEHCPFLKVGINGDGSTPRLDLRRDLEHVGSLWPAMAAKLAGFLETGTLDWGEHEAAPEEWALPYAPRLLPTARLRELLSSGANYAGARAVNSFFFDTARDHTGLLAECAEAMPVCHGTLHMVHRYAMLRPAAALLHWCLAQKRKVAEFTSNGPEYQRRYLERLDEIMDSVAMHSVARSMGMPATAAVPQPRC